MPDQPVPSVVDRFEEAYAEFARGDVGVLDSLDMRDPSLGDIGFCDTGLVSDDPWSAAEILVGALPRAAVWHPGQGGRLLANIAHTLGRLGEFDAAERFARRALGLDPVNPIALSALGVARARRDEHHGAWSVRQYLVRAGYGPEVHGDLDRVLKPGDHEAPAFQPSLDGLRRSTSADWACLAARTEHDPNDEDKAKARAMALGAAMRGQWGVARWYAEYSVITGWYGPEEHTTTEEVWSRELAALLAPTAGDEWLDEGHQWTFMDNAIETRDPAVLEAMLHFSDPVSRLRAAELFTGEAGTQLLAEAAAAEVHTGDCLAPPGESRAATALYRRRRAQTVGHRPRILPEEGADHPAFAAAGQGEACYIWVTANDSWPFLRVSHGSFAVERAIDAAEHRLGEQWLGRLTLDGDSCTRQVQFEHTADPAAALRVILDEFAHADVPADEIFIAKVRVSPDGIPRPVEDPRRAAAEPAESEEDFWRRSFDPSARPLPAEREGLSGLFAPSVTGPVPQLRIAAPWFDDLTVIGGLVRGVEQRAPDARHDEVVASLRRHLAEQFFGLPPTFLSRTGDRDGRIDPIRYADRNGFAFAVSGFTPEFVVYYPEVFRCREAEMFAAVRAVVRECGLAPVVHWSRTGGTWIYNIWER